MIRCLCFSNNSNSVISGKMEQHIPLWHCIWSVPLNQITEKPAQGTWRKDTNIRNMYYLIDCNKRKDHIECLLKVDLHKQTFPSNNSLFRISHLFSNNYCDIYPLNNNFPTPTKRRKKSVKEYANLSSHPYRLLKGTQLFKHIYQRWPFY